MISTTNSLKRINKEICRCTWVVGVFPNNTSCLRLISACLMKISEEWQIGKNFLFWQIIQLLKINGYFGTEFTEKGLRNRSIFFIALFLLARSSLKVVAIISSRVLTPNLINNRRRYVAAVQGLISRIDAIALLGSLLQTNRITSITRALKSNFAGLICSARKSA